MEHPGNHSPRQSLRGHLVRLVAALAIPLLLLQGWWSLHDYRGARQRAEADALSFADATALGVRQFYSVAEDLMTATAEQFGEHGPDQAECKGHMQVMMSLLPFLTNALAVDAEGHVVCSFLDAPTGASAVGWPWWPEMVREPHFIRGAPVVGDFTGSWIMPLAVPLMDESGSFNGAIVGSVELTDLSAHFGGVNLPASHLVTVATADRTVVARSEDAEERVGRPLPPLTGSDREVAPGRWVATGPDLAGTPRTWGQVELEDGWIVYVGVPDALVYGPARREALEHVGATLLVLLLGMLLARRSYNRIAGALHELALRTRRREAGAPVPMPGDAPTEVSEVVEEFNRTLRARDLAEAAERRARERFQSIFDNAVFGLCVTTPEGRFLQANPALVSMLGYDSERALIEVGARAAQPDGTTREGLILADTWGGQKRQEVELLRADGSRIFVRLSGSRIEGPDGQPAFETIVQDITDEKRTEDQLRQTQKMEAMGQLAGGLAHDFNNLLTVIGGNVELLDEGLGGEDPLREDLAQISKATARANSLTRRLLAFSRRTPRGSQVIDINEVVPDIGEMVVPLLGENVTVEIGLADESLPITIDPGELEQILLNLVINSRDAMPQGGTLRITTGRGPRPGASHGGAEGILLSVSDTGTGMDDATVPRIFEPFFTTKPIGRGTGLGLSTVYGIVTRYDGCIDVDTESGSGTRMIVWFPSAVAPPEVEPPAPVAAASGTESILVVEDDELVRAFVSRALGDAGYQVRTTASGEEALRQLERDPSAIDLVLTDVVMAGVSGPELAERLATVAPSLPVLFMSGYISGYVDNPFLNSELARRPERLLRKPFSAVELRRRVRDALESTPTAPLS
jgi:PAS domain S-box-containing protein